MQPAFIRLVDNLRKQLEQSNWQGDYQEIPKWGEEVADETKARVLLLKAELEQATPEAAAEIEAALAQLPAPYPGYQLQLSQQDKQISVDIWDLCYQVCFCRYNSQTGTSHHADGSASSEVEIDRSLFDEKTGELDWNRLDEKTHELVNQVFLNLPD